MVSVMTSADWTASRCRIFSQLQSFMENTGLAILEHDGSYPGDTCAATNHPFHRGFEDSQWVQWKAITDFYKKHRDVLNADLLHLRRADGRDLDYVLHVNPAGNEKGLLMIYNPLEQDVTKTLCIPLYYTGKTTTASLRERDGAATTFKLDREYHIELPVNVPAQGVTWFVIE